MTGPEIAVALHQLVTDQIIAGWHRHSRGGQTSWVIAPHVGPSTHYSRPGIVDFIEFAQELTHA